MVIPCRLFLFVLLAGVSHAFVGRESPRVNPAWPVQSPISTRRRLPRSRWLGKDYELNPPSFLFANAAEDGADDEEEARTLRSFTQRWDDSILELLEYNATFGTVNVPQTHNKIGDEYQSLACFVLGARLKRGRLSEDRRDQLSAIGFLWDGADKAKRDQRWDDFFLRLVDYREHHGDCRVPQKWKDKDGIRLGAWVRRQRTAKKDGSLLSRREQRLAEIGFEWQIRDSGCLWTRLSHRGVVRAALWSLIQNCSRACAGGQKRPHRCWMERGGSRGCAQRVAALLRCRQQGGGCSHSPRLASPCR